MIVSDKTRSSPTTIIDTVTATMPTREVFVKETDNTFTGTGMLLLEDDTLLAPEGFATESGSINFGDLITLSEASGFLAIQNNLNGQQYRLIDHHVPKDAPSDKPGYVHMYEAENSFVAQSASTTTLNANPLIFSYTTQLTSRVNSLVFKTATAMSNFRMKVTAVDPNVVVKYFPTKAAWVTGHGGVNLTVGDNVLDFKDTPLLFNPGQELSFEIRADSVALLGNVSGVPYFSAMVQRGLFKYLADEDEIPHYLSQLNNDMSYATTSKIPSYVSQLTNDSDFATKAQAASLAPVQSVNGQSGHVTLTIPSAQVQADWNATSGISQILNKPTLFSGNYNDLSNKPTIPSNTSQLTNGAGFVTNAQASAAAPVQSVNGQAGNVTLTIPAAQVNTDWSASSGIAQLLNKPTTLGGYGITDAVSQSALTTALSSYVTSSTYTTGLASKFNVPTGTTAQYLRGDGSLATFPTIPTVNYPVTSVNTKTGAVVLATSDIAEGTNLYFTNPRVQSYLTANNYRKVETFLGTTDGSGNYTITFAGTYATAPDVQPQIIGGLFTQFIRVVSVSTTGCVVQAAQRNTVNLLATELLLGTTVALSGASVSVQVTPRAS